jgi:hypothetical protein
VHHPFVTTNRYEGNAMPTETTATIAIGPLDTQWGASVFGPDHLLQLREGSRATWVVTPLSGEVPGERSFIRPTTPDHLLAAGLLGFVALVVPDLVDGAPELRAVVRRVPDGVEVDPVDDPLARRVFAWASELVDGLVTVLPVASVRAEELELAAGYGLRIALPVDRHELAGGAR